MSTVYRGAFATLWITLQANEQLGVLDSAYLEDYYGNNGQVSLYHVASDTCYPLVMIELTQETPDIPHDVFIGQTSLAGLPDGAFEVRARVRDVVGNYSIISAVQTPIGGERLVAMGFSIATGAGYIYAVNINGALVTLGLTIGSLSGPGDARTCISNVEAINVNYVNVKNFTRCHYITTISVGIKTPYFVTRNQPMRC